MSIELPSAQQEAEKRFQYIDPDTAGNYDHRSLLIDRNQNMQPLREGYRTCYTELYLPERQRAEAQGKLIEKLVRISRSDIAIIEDAMETLRAMDGSQDQEDAGFGELVKNLKGVIKRAKAIADLSSIPAPTTKEQEP